MSGTTASGWPYTTDADEPRDFDVTSKALADKLEADAAAKVHTHALADLPTTLATDTEVTAAITAHTDTDASPTAKHHTLGTGANQAAAGDHTHTLDNLSDVATSGAVSGNSLVFSGSAWGPATVGGGGATTLDGLTDVSAASPVDGDALVWSAGASLWIPSAVEGGTGGGTPLNPTGGTVSNVGDDRVHTFTVDGTLVVPENITVRVLLVAGGGGGGINTRNGGGGAGGLIHNTSLALTAGSYSVIVGSGGTPGNNGGNSTAFGLTAVGGGKGGANESTAAGSGGSGGGGGVKFSGTSAGGAGTAGQGFAGGTITSNNDGGAAGGGATQVGASASGSTGGKGGDGFATSITGVLVTYAGGGGGSGRTTGGAGGAGGGAAGGGATGSPGTAVVNTGGGGGGVFDGAAASAGAPGVVIVRYAGVPDPLADVAHLDDLADVVIPAPVHGDVLTFDGPSGLWIAKAAGGSGGALWSSVVTDPLSSMTGWTVRQGTWAINGGVMQQSDATAGGSNKRRIVRDAGVLPVVAAAVRVEARFISGSTNEQRAGIYHGWNGSSTSGGYFGCLQTDGAGAWTAYHESDSATAGTSTDIGYDLAYGTWFSVAVRRLSGTTAELYINDVLVNSWGSAPQQGTKIGLHTFCAVVEYRNLQTWDRAEDVPW